MATSRHLGSGSPVIEPQRGRLLRVTFLCGEPALRVWDTAQSRHPVTPVAIWSTSADGRLTPGSPPSDGVRVLALAVTPGLQAGLCDLIADWPISNHDWVIGSEKIRPTRGTLAKVIDVRPAMRRLIDQLDRMAGPQLLARAPVAEPVAGWTRPPPPRRPGLRP